MENLSGQLAVITGAARGIGEAISRKLAAMGATVVLTARDEARLKHVVAEIKSVGAQAETAAFDLQDEAASIRLGDSIKERHGRCDILVNNAGVGKIGTP